MNEPTVALVKVLSEKLSPIVENLRGEGWKADLIWRRDDDGRQSFGIDVEVEARQERPPEQPDPEREDG